jgi:hypothetical protein
MEADRHYCLASHRTGPSQSTSIAAEAPRDICSSPAGNPCRTAATLVSTATSIPGTSRPTARWAARQGGWLAVFTGLHAAPTAHLLACVCLDLRPLLHDDVLLLLLLPPRGLVFALHLHARTGGSGAYAAVTHEQETHCKAAEVCGLPCACTQSKHAPRVTGGNQPCNSGMPPAGRRQALAKGR